MFHPGVTSVRILVPMNFSKIKFLLAAPAVMAAAFVAPAAQAQSADALTQYASEGRPVVSPMSQVTSVSQLRDVKPTDWSFQALQSLVERYGCIAGYPDGSFRGNRAMTRFEFAAGLNACLDRVNELIASSTSEMASKEDLAAITRLTEEFQAEIDTLKGRADGLEFRVNDLEAKQFSTTTKITGEVIMDLSSMTTGSVGNTYSTTTDSVVRNADGSKKDNESANELTLGSRVRLVLNTSFTGKDLLRTRLQAGNLSNMNTRFENNGGGAVALPAAALEYSAGGDNFALNELWYRFPAGSAKVFAGTHGLDFDKIVPSTVNPNQSYAFNDFFKFSPIYKGPRGAGAGFNYPLTGKINVAAAYLANTAGAATAGAATTGVPTASDSDNGLFGSSNSLLTQLTYTPTPAATLAVAYSHNYNPDSSAPNGGSGTNLAANPLSSQAGTSDNVSLQGSYKFSPKFNVSGWVGWSWLNSTTKFVTDAGSAVAAGFPGTATSPAATKNGEATTFNWAVNLGFADFLKEGNYAGVGFGVVPHVTDSNIVSYTVTSGDKTGDRVRRENRDTPYIINAFYNYKLSDNISVQPQVAYIINPDGDKNNDNIWIGSLRTTFKF